MKKIKKKLIKLNDEFKKIKQNIFIIINVNKIKPININKILLNHTNFLLKNNFAIVSKKKIEDLLSFIDDYEIIKEYKFEKLKIYLILLENKDFYETKIKENFYDYSWRKYIDFYKYSDKSVYCNILNNNFNSHLYNKIYFNKDSYIRLKKIYCDILTYYEFIKTT